MNRKTLLIIVLCTELLIGIGLLCATFRSSDPSPTPETPWKVWQGSDVKISYPPDFTAYEGESAHGGLIGRPIVTFAFPLGSFSAPKTNYGEAYLAISQTQTAEEARDCFTNAHGGNPESGFGSTVFIHGVEFRKALAVDPAAGNIYASEVYRTIRNGSCYELALTVHTGNIYNYDPGTVVEFDKEQAFGTLRMIRDTFVFTK